MLATLKSTFGDELVLLGRVDQTRPQGGVIVLGQLVTAPHSHNVWVGDYVAALGAPASQGQVDGEALLNIGLVYVPGASQVFLKGQAAAPISSFGTARVGSQDIDLTPTLAVVGHVSRVTAGAIVEISGSQLSIDGVVIATAVGVDGSLGTGRTNGSLGTGRTDGSLGTGR